jgi:hypothetical protein
MLISPGFNPNTIENFSFDYAHTQYAEYEDGLQVVARLAGETDWTVLWERYGADLSVEDCYTWFWSDTNGEVSWETVTLDVPSHWDTSGATCAEIAFVNVGGYGNHTWIDNVMVGSPVGVDLVDSYLDEILIYPNPTTGLFTVKTHNSDATNFYIFDSLGKLIDSGEVNLEVQLDLSGLNGGLYHLVIPGYSSERIILQSHRN